MQVFEFYYFKYLINCLFKIAGTLLIQPVEWHMKKVEEEVDEKQQLLLTKHNAIVIRRNSNTNGEVNRRVTEPGLTSVYKNEWDGKVSKSHVDLNVTNKTEKEANGVNGT